MESAVTVADTPPRRMVLKGVAAGLAAPALLGLPGCDAGEGIDAALKHISGGFVAPHEGRGHALRDAWRHGAAVPEPVRTQRARVVIVGGGVAGLAAARGLLQAGEEDVALLELEDAAGGNARSATLGGMPCPLGAHYLPVPHDDAPEVQALLQDLGLLAHRTGRWQVTALGERHLCHSPQERLWMRTPAGDGFWQDGLLPVQGVGADTLAAYARFAQVLEAEQRPGLFRLPVARSDPRWVSELARLDAQTFAHWLDGHGLVDPHLRAYLDYCCRDDYGAPARVVSAWAGLHYFASRHGFHPPRVVGGAPEPDANPERDAVFTWPEGNAWLTTRLAAPLKERLHTGAAVRRVSVPRSGPVQIDALNARGEPIRWLAHRVVLATPLWLSQHLLTGDGVSPAAREALGVAARQLRAAPWLVANLQLNGPLRDPAPRPWWRRVADTVQPPAEPHHAPRSWDNVLHDPSGQSDSLGYVDATHQGLRPHDGPTVLTHYRALGGADMAAARSQLLATPWRDLARHSLKTLSEPHPDLPSRVQRIDIARWGHAMACPVPGARTSAALAALQRLPGERVQFAHSDLSGYSVFEEAFTQGLRAARALL